MNILNFESLKREIIRKCELNADRTTYENCYKLIANKELLNEIDNERNEIIFGIRGSGKTTLLKAFYYYINYNLYKNEPVSCYYCEMLSKIPNQIEYKSINNPIDASIIVIKYFLLELVNSIIDDFNYLEKKQFNKTLVFKSKYAKKEIDKLATLILELEDAINKGTPYTKAVTKKNEEYSSDSKKKGKGLSISISSKIKSPKDILPSFKLNIIRRIARIVNSNYSEEVSYSFNIFQIRKLLNSIISLSGLKKFYICIDEFYMVDRDMNFSIQPKVAQLIKDLFFKTGLYCIKISSVYSESKMQMRQNFQREGIEINNDIFTGPNLDAMHKNDEEAKIFFKDILCNIISLNNSNINNGEEKKYFREAIIQKLFQNEIAFERLICGSNGTPRTFLLLLNKCLEKTKEGKILLNTVMDEIINNYSIDAKMKIDFSKLIMKTINNYVYRKKCRFFFLKHEDYINRFFTISELLDKEIIQIHTSAQLPRNILESYKLFTVHYGNYLGSLGVDAFKEFINQKEILTPHLPGDIETTIKSYILDIPEAVDREYYCYRCRKIVTISQENKNVILCPICNCEINIYH